MTSSVSLDFLKGAMTEHVAQEKLTVILTHVNVGELSTAYIQVRHLMQALSKKRADVHIRP